MSMKMTMAEFVGFELCPFCKGEAFYNPEYNGGNVECRECGAEGPYKRTEAEAIAAWNTRAERTCRIEWRDDSHDTDAGYERDGAYFCTACGADLPYLFQECWDDYQAGNYEKPFNYCPSCGCKVR